jgi:hypothetical protein
MSCMPEEILMRACHSVSDQSEECDIEQEKRMHYRRLQAR